MGKIPAPIYIIKILFIYMIGILQRTLGQQRTFGQQRTLGQQRTKRFSRTNKLQNSHNKSKKTKSYTPTINQELFSFKYIYLYFFRVVHHPKLSSVPLIALCGKTKLWIAL